jgi:LCP family protein required for cell wall assembly
MLLQAVGTDSRTSSYLYGLADVIRILRADFVNEKVQILSLPRDLWVNVPNLEQHGISAAKLSQVYFYGTEGMGYYGGTAWGSGLLAETLQYNYDLRVDNYLTVNMETFARMVDAVGGIPIYVPADIDGRYDPVTEAGEPLPELEKIPENGFFEAGSYFMDGDLALVYARVRAGDNDFQRQQRQVQVLKALRERVLSPDVIGAVPELIQAFQGAVLTDLTPEQITQLSCLGLKLSDEDIEFLSLPETMFVAGMNNEGQWILNAIETEIREGLMKFVTDGVWPEAMP